MQTIQWELCDDISFTDWITFSEWGIRKYSEKLISVGDVNFIRMSGVRRKAVWWPLKTLINITITLIEVIIVLCKYD